MTERQYSIYTYLFFEANIILRSTYCNNFYKKSWPAGTGRLAGPASQQAGPGRQAGTVNTQHNTTVQYQHSSTPGTLWHSHMLSLLGAAKACYFIFLVSIFITPIIIYILISAVRYKKYLYMEVQSLATQPTMEISSISFHNHCLPVIFISISMKQHQYQVILL